MYLEIPPALNAIYLTFMSKYLRDSMRKFDEEGFRKEIDSIVKQSCVFNIAVVIELLSIICFRLYVTFLGCHDIEHTEFGCDMNSTRNFTLRMTFIFTDTLSKFTYCMYFLWV